MERLNRQEVVTAFYGLGTHWGNARSQNAKGHVVRLPAGCLTVRHCRLQQRPPAPANCGRRLLAQVGHVKDLGLDPDAPDVRVYATKIAQVVGRRGRGAVAALRGRTHAAPALPCTAGWA